MRYSKLILLVENHSDSAELMSYILGKHGYRAVVAESSECAKNILSIVTPDLVVLDCFALEASNSLLSELKRQGLARCTILCSTQDNLQTFCNTEGVGFSVKKPFDVDEFVSVVQKADAVATKMRNAAHAGV
jgi:DNA-binding NtrC family response regulator